MKAPLPLDEEERLAALHEYEILDTLPEQVETALRTAWSALTVVIE